MRILINLSYQDDVSVRPPVPQSNMRRHKRQIYLVHLDKKGAATTSTRSKVTNKYTGRAGADSAVYTGYLSFRQEIKDT